MGWGEVFASTLLLTEFLELPRLTYTVILFILIGFKGQQKLPGRGIMGNFYVCLFVCFVSIRLYIKTIRKD